MVSQPQAKIYQQLITVETGNFDFYSEEEYTIEKQALKQELYLGVICSNLSESNIGCNQSIHSDDGTSDNN